MWCRPFFEVHICEYQVCIASDYTGAARCHFLLYELLNDTVWCRDINNSINKLFMYGVEKIYINLVFCIKLLTWLKHVILV